MGRAAVRNVPQAKKRPLNIVLVDDNVFRYGWGEVLCMALGVKPTSLDLAKATGLELLGKRDEPSSPIQVHGVPSGEQWAELTGLLMPETRTDSEASGDGSPASNLAMAPVDCRYRLVVKGVDDPVDILFLDLRLHQGKSLAVEATFFQRLWTVANQYCDNVPPGSSPQALPWPGFTRKELDMVKEWIEKACTLDATADRTSPAYRSALTLLPRLVALADHSLPIVLFSSTGQREIVEILRPTETLSRRLTNPDWRVPWIRCS